MTLNLSANVLRASSSAARAGCSGSGAATGFGPGDDSATSVAARKVTISMTIRVSLYQKNGPPSRSSTGDSALHSTPIWLYRAHIKKLQTATRMRFADQPDADRSLQ